MRFILIGLNQKVIDDIEMPKDTPILDIIRMDNRYYLLDRQSLNGNVVDFFFYERLAYDWLEEIELKRVKH